MTEDFSERRMAANEVIFRRYNEKVVDSLAELKEAVESEGHSSLVRDIDKPLHFYCECSDEKCSKRIIITPSQYKKLHQKKNQFIVLPGHVVPEYEHVVQSAENYLVVEKYLTPPSATDKLNPTGLNHS